MRSSPAGGPVADTGSFRDRSNCVFSHEGRILRGLSAEAAAIVSRLLEEPFFAELVESGQVVETWKPDGSDPAAARLREQGWTEVVEHRPIPFVSYVYEWSFAMLKAAALAQLHIIEQALESGWTLKDASPYNLQWVGSAPVFIDIGSFEPWQKGSPWIGYRQFCAMFLFPLMLKAHLEVDHHPLSRSLLDGIEPRLAAKLFRGFSRFKRGVASHVLLPAAVEARISRRERDRAPSRERGQRRHSKAMLLGLIQGLGRLVRKLESAPRHTDWSRYAQTHSYEEADFAKKQSFVEGCLESGGQRLVWDIGCNTGVFSRIAARHSEYVVSMDGDPDSIDELFRAESAAAGEKILPLVADLSNLSPDQGWDGAERRSLERRGRPDMVLCLAVVHHMRVSANVPLPMFLGWLRSLDARVVLEFVDRDDEMFVKLLTNKTETYPDYTRKAFVAGARAHFEILERCALKDGRRELFLLAPL